MAVNASEIRNLLRPGLTTLMAPYPSYHPVASAVTVGAYNRGTWGSGSYATVAMAVTMPAVDDEQYIVAEANDGRWMEWS